MNANPLTAGPRPVHPEPAVFARGEAYRREGRVALLAVEPHEVRARVSGSQVCAVTLKGAPPR
jgi:uncharacterized Zn finger protein